MIQSLLDRVRSIIADDKGLVGSIIAIVVLAAVSVAVDMLAPETTWFHYLRAVLALALSAPLFVGGYFLADKQHQANVRKADEDGDVYIPFKSRYLPSQRQNQSIVVVGVMLAIIIVSSFTALYTVGAAVVLATSYAMVAYCSLSDEERELKDIGVDDRSAGEFVKSMDDDEDADDGESSPDHR
jgi:hypothetical protein